MAASWRKSLHQGADWFNQRPIRERVLIAATALVLVLFVGWELAVAPALSRQGALESRVGMLGASRDSLVTQEQALTRQLARDPSEELRRQLESRQQRLAQLDRQIASATGQLIAPRAMVSLLKDMLSAQQSLALQTLELKTPTPVFATESDAPAGANSSNPGFAVDPLLYAHDVELTIEGGYLDVLAYLKRLEALDERLGWMVLEYDAENWPAGEAVIRVRTLSLEPAWLGV